jgi:hypothetical protein
MTSRQRALKRFSIVAIVFFTVGLVWSSLVIAFQAKVTCSDGKQNQGEKGIDCGGPCNTACPDATAPQDLIVREAVFVPGGDPGSYDVLVQVNNPNDELGASMFDYTLSLKSANGETLAEHAGKGFILPQETKYFLGVNFVTQAAPVRAEITFAATKWEKFSGYQEKPRLSVLNKEYIKIASGAFFSEAKGNVVNDSTFDFRTLTVKIVLRDVSGKALALNQTEMNTVLAKEMREFQLKWPKAFPGDVARVDVEVEANVYHTGNFIQRYIPEGKFQDMQGGGQ